MAATCRVERIVRRCAAADTLRDTFPCYSARHTTERGGLVAPRMHRMKDGVSSVRAAHATEETMIAVVGRAAAITTGFPSAVEAAGWRWEEVPDLLALVAHPLAAQTVIALPLPAFTDSSCAIIRQLTNSLTLPLVVFSAECRAEAIDAALRAGADDFLPLPVTTEEMVARLAAVIRVRFGAREELQRSDYRFDEGARTVTVTGGPPVRLAAGEYRLFRMLFAARNRPVARERLAAIPLPHSDLDGQNALDATVSRLRRKLGGERIVTVRGIGYQLVDSRQPPDNLSYMHEALAARKPTEESNGRHTF
jgi:two-component system, OmpR family, response regulator